MSDPKDLPSTTGFTPGPWTVGGTPSLKIWADYKQIVVAECWVIGFSTQAKANAHLIAAAPELYEALEIARLYVESYLPADNEDAAADLKLIDAALAKARGEKP